MKIGVSLQELKAMTTSPRLMLAGGLCLSATAAFARQPNAVPEPSILSLVGVAVVAGIVAYRIKNKK